MKEKIGPLKKKLQRIINKKVRERDKDLGCICYGCENPVQVAAHFIPKRGYDYFRYDMDNIHGCCVGCNTYKEGNTVAFRIGLVERYGEEYVKNIEKKLIDYFPEKPKLEIEDVKKLIEKS